MARFIIRVCKYCHREGVKCLQNLLEGDDMMWHCLLSFAYKLRHAFYHVLSSHCHRERSRTTGTSVQTAIHNHLTYIVLYKHVIGSGVERLVRQCKPQKITTLLTVFCANMSFVAESNDWYVSTNRKK